MTPYVSIIIPTYNSSKTLQRCLESIKEQSYSGNMEIIIADGGSTDDTIDIAKTYTNKIYSNYLKTGEAGKAIGLKHANGEIIAFIDSDNILPYKDWLSIMVMPFDDPDIAGTEPLYYTYRKKDGYITRYCAMMGMNDPLCFFIGNYDRMNIITEKWTEMPIKEIDMGNYIKVELDEKKLPTIGANGFLVRRSLLDEFYDYFFDIDAVYELVIRGHTRFAKVKIGIVHLFSGSLSTFYKKQRRRINDYGYYEKMNIRRYPWSALSKWRLLKFIIYTITTVPLLGQATIGWRKKNDRAWAFHCIACWSTLVIYTIGSLKNTYHSKAEDRTKWK